MSTNILLYRLYRNRRVILFGVAIPVLVVLAAGLLTGSSHPFLMAMAVVIPAAHAMRYSNVVETFNVSLTLAICLGLAALGPEQIAIGAMLMRAFWLLVLAIVVFMVLTFFTVMVPFGGPVASISTRAVAVSRLDADTLRRVITLYPERKDDRTICGEAGEHGIFDVDILMPCDFGNYQSLCTDAGEDPCGADAQGEEADKDEAIDPQVLEDMANGVLRTKMKALVFESSSDHHEVFCMDGGEEVIVTRYQFKPLKSGGTKVIYEESGAKMPLVMRFGYWLQDCSADCLTDEIDRAEGRARRANRAHPQSQLIVDIANCFVPLLRRQGLS